MVRSASGLHFFINVSQEAGCSELEFKTKHLLLETQEIRLYECFRIRFNVQRQEFGIHCTFKSQAKIYKILT